MLEKGDYLERTWKDTIREKVPAYEEIWAKFIGHDGYGRMIPAESLNEKEQLNRVKFSEYNYTCLESLVCLIHISENVGDVSNEKTYLNALNSILAFHANTGRIRDNLIKMMEIYLHKDRMNELIIELEDIYQKRNNALHGKKLPFRLEDSILLIAKIKGVKENQSEWNSSMTWGEYKDELIFLDDYYKESVKEIAIIYNKILQNLKEPIFNLIKEKDIKIIFPEIEIQTGRSGYNPYSNCASIGYSISGSSIDNR